MADFNNLEPKKDVTDPKSRGVGLKEFPRHVYAPSKTDVDAIVVAWKGKQPVYNRTRLVIDPADLEDALSKGYTTEPIVAVK